MLIHSTTHCHLNFIIYSQIKLIINFSDGNILSYGSEDLVISPNYEYDTVIDCNGGTILPGKRTYHLKSFD